jgi:peptidoglycan lytic transglycosylase G
LRRLLLTAIAVIALFVVGLAASVTWIYSQLDTPYYGARSSEVYIDIPHGANANETAALLAGAGVLKYQLPFKAYLRFTNKGRRIQAGEYRFSQAATPRQIIERRVQGDVFFSSVTIPEGLTAQETVDLLVKNGLGNRAELERALLNKDWIIDLDSRARNLEGYLFPETYHFKRRVDSETIIKTMTDQFRLKVTSLLSSHPLQPGWDISKAVILASMIEKEVKRPEEGPLVASVLINRLEKGMPLACDATIIYAMKLAGIYEGRLSKADLAMESPYNSYHHLGLPPGPISNPGANALRAALNPARTDYFYYVSRNDGTHQFSKDYRAHIRAVNMYQKPLARRR